MKAIVLQGVGGVENLCVQEVNDPVVQAGEVLIKVEAIGINPVDFKARMLQPLTDMLFGEGARDIVLGWDVAGVVQAVGEGVMQFAVGDRVFGMVNFPGAGNAYAELVAAPAAHLAKIPADISVVDAAATTLAALTALQVLQSRVGAGDKVLIHAGSGGVGHFAIQIAKQLGAHVITTCSARNRDFVLGLGANEHIDYRTQDFVEELSDLDFVLDSLGGENLARSLEVVKDGGTIVTLPTWEFDDALKERAAARGVDVSFMLVESNGDDMQQLADWLTSGVLTPHISQTFGFAQMGEAHQALESGRTVGKIVVKL